MKGRPTRADYCELVWRIENKKNINNITKRTHPKAGRSLIRAREWKKLYRPLTQNRLFTAAWGTITHTATHPAGSGSFQNEKQCNVFLVFLFLLIASLQRSDLYRGNAGVDAICVRASSACGLSRLFGINKYKNEPMTWRGCHFSFCRSQPLETWPGDWDWIRIGVSLWPLSRKLSSLSSLVRQTDKSAPLATHFTVQQQKFPHRDLMLSCFLWRLGGTRDPFYTAETITVRPRPVTDMETLSRAKPRTGLPPHSSTPFLNIRLAFAEKPFAVMTIDGGVKSIGSAGQELRSVPSLLVRIKECWSQACQLQIGEHWSEGEVGFRPFIARVTPRSHCNGCRLQG